MLETITPPSSPAPLEDSLALAFPALDAPQDALAHLADVAPAADLLAVTPPAPQFSLDDLIRELDNRRIIIRNEGIPVATLIAIGGTFFFHMLLVGMFFLALYLGLLNVRNGHSNVAILGDEGGSGDGYMIMGDAPQGPAALVGTVDNLLAHAPTAPPATEFPNIPDNLAPANPTPDQLAAASPDPNLIGIPTGLAVTGQLKPRAIPTTPPAPNSLAVAPPPIASPSAHNNLLASAAGRTGPIAGSPNGGLGEGGDDEGPLLALTKPGHGGEGHGRGNKIGEGTDRGDSAANNPNPGVIDAPPLDLPDSMARMLPRQSAVFEVTVLPNGRAGTITLTHSCGNADIDAICKATILRYRFRPATLAGKPIEKSMTVTQDFGAAQ